MVFKTVHFNSKAKPIIYEKSNQETLNAISVWSSEDSGWTVESIDKQYINIVNYKPSKGSSHIELPPELRNSGKGLINLKNNDNECFKWCHIRHLNPQQKSSEDQKMR